MYLENVRSSIELLRETLAVENSTRKRNDSMMATSLFLSSKWTTIFHLLIAILYISASADINSKNVFVSV